MGLFGSKELTVNEGINHARTEVGAILLDIRSKEDFQTRHVKGAINIPLDRMDLIERRIPNKEAHLYIVGSVNNRPKKAIKPLKKLGYNNTTPCGLMEEHNVSLYGR